MSQPESYLMTVGECAAFLRFSETAKDPEHATRQWLKRRAVPSFRRGRHVLVSRTAVMDALAADSRPRSPRIDRRRA